MLSELRVLFRRALSLLLLADVVYCQSAPTYDPSPFNFIGTIDDMTLDLEDGVLAGGTITVNNFVVTVPKNLLVTLPSISVAWSEMFTINEDNSTTPNLPLFGAVSWEATIFGNIVKGESIAGLIYIVQESTQLLQGFITSINFTNGHFVVDNKVECVLNDPVGRFGHAYTANPIWTVDPDNPSVRSSTGVPLCFPRNTTDPECPLTNRPTDGTGAYLTAFTFPAPNLVSPGGLDPRIMVPLAVGDYITFSGTRTAEDVLEVYSLEANLGIYTAPGTQPAYLTVEAAQYAIVVPDPTVEVDETRSSSMADFSNTHTYGQYCGGTQVLQPSSASDPSIPINWFAIDVDPCTGEETERMLMPDVLPESAAPAGRTIFRLGKIDASPATREVGVRYTKGASAGPRGLIAGQFVQPIFVYIFPELISFGSHELANQFELILYLAMAVSLARESDTGDHLVRSPVLHFRDKLKFGLLDTVASNQKGVTMTTVTASTSSLTAQLFLAVTGVDSVPAQAMFNLGQGQFSLTITTKGKPSSVTVTSSENGLPATQAV
ncbi:hypothetical protein C8R46DRAFT_1343732 [Mycena filopes]|nr:hypothetical protein C8R46DRAFT_1343732 [Mycena filopes]